MEPYNEIEVYIHKNRSFYSIHSLQVHFKVVEMTVIGILT